MLRWYKRLEIAVGVAQGLDYLHSFAVQHLLLLLNLHLAHVLANLGFENTSC